MSTNVKVCKSRQMSEIKQRGNWNQTKITLKEVSDLWKQREKQARSQDFFVGGGGGGAYLKNRDQIMNVLNDTLC